MHLVGDGLVVLSDAMGIHAKAQATSHFLSFLRHTVALAQGTNLEYIGIVPSLPQGGVGEDEAHGFVETQQPLLVLQDKVVCRGVIALV